MLMRSFDVAKPEAMPEARPEARPAEAGPFSRSFGSERASKSSPAALRPVASRDAANFTAFVLGCIEAKFCK